MLSSGSRGASRCAEGEKRVTVCAFLISSCAARLGLGRVRSGPLIGRKGIVLRSGLPQFPLGWPGADDTPLSIRFIDRALFWI